MEALEGFPDSASPTHTHTHQKCLSSCQHVKEINMTSFQGNVSHAFKTRCDLSDFNSGISPKMKHSGSENKPP